MLEIRGGDRSRIELGRPLARGLAGQLRDVRRFGPAMFEGARQAREVEQRLEAPGQMLGGGLGGLGRRGKLRRAGQLRVGAGGKRARRR